MPGIIGFIMAVLNQGDLLILVAVFGATISYVMMTLSHIILRIKEPRPAAALPHARVAWSPPASPWCSPWSR